jgi:hypothetical protein
MRLIVRSGAFLSIGFVVVAVVVGCGSSTRSSAAPTASIDFIAPNASSLLRGRRLAIELGNDISVLYHGRVLQVSKGVRVAVGGTGCYFPNGSSGPCYDSTGPFSLSPDGKHLAFFLTDGYSMSPALIVSRFDGSHSHDVTGNLVYAPFSSLSAPSWDRNGRSFVVDAVTAGLDYNSQEQLTEEDEDTGIFRVEAVFGKVKPLTQTGADTYNDAQPRVSPDGREIAFLRSSAPEPSAGFGNGVVAFVYVMGANGKAPTRLPLPPRTYVDLWWCGNSTTLCVDSPTKRLAASANTYRVDLRTGRVTHLRHWAEASYSGLSADGTFAIDERRTARGAEVFVGPVSAAGVARFAPVLADANAKGNPFFGFSVSGR